MILGIDATNIRTGGGLYHLKHLIEHGEPTQQGFSKILMWGSAETLSRLGERPWLVKRPITALSSNLFVRTYWRFFCFGKILKNERIDLLFVPGGSLFANFKPFVTISQNLLPFDWVEIRRFGISLMMFKMVVLRLVQARTFRKAQGIIFLTSFARNHIMSQLGDLTDKSVIIPHGIDTKFYKKPKDPITAGEAKRNGRRIKIVYVSIVEQYKHQWNVVRAVRKLSKNGYPIFLDLIGPASPAALLRLENALSEDQNSAGYCRYHGEIDNADLPKHLKEADIFIFASSCENMPLILLEGMASGLPIVCSDRGPMPEILGSGGVYFNPENVESIVVALEQLISSKKLMVESSSLAYKKAKKYSWPSSSLETFKYLSEVASS